MVGLMVRRWNSRSRRYRRWWCRNFADASTGAAGTVNTGGGGGGGDGGTGGAGVLACHCSLSHTNYGTLYLGSTNTSSADLAEYYVSGDDSIEAGDVVTISQKSKVKSQNGEDVDNKGVLMKADKPYDSKLIGIISTNPGVLMGSVDGENKADKRMLALAGRVPVKIDPDSPPIEVGDFLTSSSKPGYAMKATKAGYTVAKALESWAPGGPELVEGFVTLSYYMGELTEQGNLKTVYADRIESNAIRTKTLEVGGRDMLKEIDDLKRRLDALEKR